MAMRLGLGQLFIGTLSANDKKYVKELLVGARAAGYTRFVEPCAGALAMSYIAVDAGFEPKNIEASDITMFSGILGRYVEGRSLDDMRIRADYFEDEELLDAPTALFAQHYLRMVNSAGHDYFLELMRDMKLNRDRYVEELREQLDSIAEPLRGMSYRDLDLFDHLEGVWDDPTAVVVICPPTYTAGYEKFFYTGGRIKWREPAYSIFDAEEGVGLLYERAKDAKCLFVCYEEVPIGNPVGEPVYGRAAGREGWNMYLTSNRPAEVEKLVGGKTVVRKGASLLEPLKFPIIPPSHSVTAQSAVSLVRITSANANYYRKLWTHNFTPSSSGGAFALIVDGYVAGIFGYVQMSVSLGGAEYATLGFGMSAPHPQRLNRLLYMLATNESSLRFDFSDVSMLKLKGIQTVMLTKYPESKEMRGLMKLVAKEKDARQGYKLVYRCPMLQRTTAETVQEWLAKEEKWLKSRQK